MSCQIAQPAHLSVVASPLRARCSLNEELGRHILLGPEKRVHVSGVARFLARLVNEATAAAAGRHSKRRVDDAPLCSRERARAGMQCPLLWSEPRAIIRCRKACT